MSQIPAVQVAVAGEALIDLIARADGAYEPCLGGAVYNLARALARQGVGTAYLNPLSSDRFGRLLAQQMLADSVVLGQPEPSQAVTSLAVVTLTTQGHPDYAFYREGVADRQVCAQGLTAQCLQWPDLKWICTGGLALDPRDASVYLPWLQSQRDAGRFVVVDANLRPSVMPDLPAYRAHVLKVLAQADLLKVSDEDLAHLALPGGSVLSQAENLLGQLSAGWLVLTLGGSGAWLLARDGRRWHAREAQPLQVVDTVGAGDSFLAGLLAAMAREPGPLAEFSSAQVQRVLGHALASASLCVQERGCVPPSWAQAQGWAQQHPALTG
jgi:fructokinase